MVILELIQFLTITALIVLPLSGLCFLIYKTQICANQPDNLITPSLALLAHCFMTMVRLCKRGNTENSEVSV